MRKVAFLALLVVAACVDVPRAVRTDFAEPKPHERSNFRKGAHGEKPEGDGMDAGADAESDTDAEGAPAREDGGAS